MKVYFDTSVVIALADPLDTFHVQSIDFLDKIASGKMEYYVSSPLIAELGRIAKVKGTKRCLDIVSTVENSGIKFRSLDLQKVWRLSQSYLDGRILATRHRLDLFHYAAASLLGCRYIASWNNKQFNARIAAKISEINAEHGLLSLIAGKPDITRLENLG